MKKTLVALAALAATSAFAQSSVSLYGTLDLGYSSAQYEKNGVIQTKRNGPATSAHDTSRWGVTGTEDLGGGLKASFKVESNIGTNPRSGIAQDYAMKNGTVSGNGYTLDATVLGDRELWVAAENASGTRLTAGYGVTAMRNLAVQTSADGTNVMGNPINHVVGAFRREGVTLAQTYGAWTASGIAFGNRQQTDAAKAQTAGGGAAGDTMNGKGYSAALTYTQGAINAGAAVDEVRAKNPAMDAGTLDWGTTFALPANIAAADATSKTTLLAGSYDLGVAKLYAQNYGLKITKEGQNGTAVGEGKRNANSFGVRVPFGALSLNAQMFSGKDKVYVTAGTGEDRKWTGQTLGAVYSLSKRTSVYGYTGFYKTDASTSSGAAANDGTKYKQTSAGVVHYF